MRFNSGLCIVLQSARTRFESYWWLYLKYVSLWNCERVHWLTDSLTDSLPYSLTDTHIHLFSLTDWVTDWLIHPLTHSLAANILYLLIKTWEYFWFRQHMNCNINILVYTFVGEINKLCIRRHQCSAMGQMTKHCAALI